MVLLTPGQIDEFKQNVDIFSAVSDWISGYLVRPHKELGRAGPVCPYTPAALVRDTLRITVVRFTGSDRGQEIRAAVLRYKGEFLGFQAAQSEEAILNAILIAFPDVSLEEAPTLIDRTKEDLKPQFVDEGLMLGEFHSLNQSPGLHNSKFRPLRSPVPMLVIRQMVPTDIAFLNRAEDDPVVRVKFLTSYLRTQLSISPDERRTVEQALQSLQQPV
jgi:hypothetical protein